MMLCERVLLMSCLSVGGHGAHEQGCRGSRGAGEPQLLLNAEASGELGQVP